MKRIINTINALVFLFAATLVAAIFYEGLTLQWYACVPILILATDISFIIAAILNLLFNRESKILLLLDVFSVVLIVIAVFMKAFNITYPKWSLMAWDFYILYLYGIRVFGFVQKAAKNKLQR
jgi:hypothetical protein